MVGRIISIRSNLFIVDVDGIRHGARARGKFRFDELTPLVGDFVEIDENDYILNIKDRKNYFDRPKVANIDASIVVSSLKHPDFSAYLLDKMLVSISSKDIKPIICFTKYDLLEDDEKSNIDEIIKYYKDLGYEVVFNTEVDKIKKLISGLVVNLVGQTGVGKSTLLNKISPGLNLETNDISEALGRGKHTTRHVELYKIDDFLIADTPGFSAFDCIVDKENIRFYFPEFNNDECKFRGCLHMSEIGCKVKEDVDNNKIMLSRYESYKKMVVESENISINFKK